MQFAKNRLFYSLVLALSACKPQQQVSDPTADDARRRISIGDGSGKFFIGSQMGTDERR